jgi:hypothetical protein
MAFLNSPCHETPKNAIKKSNKTTEGEKKNGGKKNRIFCDEPRWTFSKKSFFRVFELPLLRNAKKTPLKKSIKNKNKNKNKIK